MATIQINQPLNLFDLNTYEGEVTSATWNRIELTNGNNEVVLEGMFGSETGGHPVGNLQAVTLLSAGQTIFTATGLNYSVSRAVDLIEAGQFETALGEALAGDDSIRGSSGADTIFAGLGNDTVESGQGDDLVFGGNGAGSDSIRLGAGNDQAYGGADNDTIEGNADNDTIGGGLGADSIDGGDGADQIFGGGGDFADRIRGGGGNDVIYAGAGDDTVGGSDGNDTIGGGAGADVIRGGAGDDIIYLGANDGAADRLVTGTNPSEGSGVGNGNDTVYAFENGRDVIDVRDSGITQFSQLTVSAAADGDAIITLASGQTILLEGVNASLIDASDFVF